MITSTMATCGVLIVPLCLLLFLSLRVVVLVVLWGVLLLMAYKVFTMEREYTEYDPYSILELDSVCHLSDRNPLATVSLSLSLFLPLILFSSLSFSSLLPLLSFFLSTGCFNGRNQKTVSETEQSVPSRQGGWRPGEVHANC